MIPRPNLILIGFMATGKSAIGRRCAAALRFAYCDTDRLVADRAGLTIPEIFASRGEEAFRELEAAVIRDLAARARLVVSTGGGAPLRAENARALREAGVVILLRTEPEEILRRAGDCATRPLLAGAKDPLERVRSLLAEREPAYMRIADAVVDTTDLPRHEAVRRVLAAYREASRRRLGASP